MAWRLPGPKEAPMTTTSPYARDGDAGDVPSFREICRALAFVLPPILIYTAGLPLLGLRMDREHGVALSLPPWVFPIAVVLMVSGVLVAGWSAALLVTHGRGTPNPVRPPHRLVTTGPYAWSRNPLMVGGWAFGTGLGLALESASLLAIYLAVALVGLLYTRKVEEPKLLERFGGTYLSYAERVPRWLLSIGLLPGLSAGVLEAQQSTPSLQPAPLPAVVVRIDVAPGGTDRWMALFEAHMAPAIRDAIAHGEEIVDFEYFEGLVSSESTDVVLVMKAESFAFFDERRPFPHYQALFHRVGPDEGRRIIGEMSSLEHSVEVTLVRAYRDGEREPPG